MAAVASAIYAYFESKEQLESPALEGGLRFFGAHLVGAARV